MEVKTEQDLALAENLLSLRKQVDAYDAAGDGDELGVRLGLSVALHTLDANWRENQKLIDRVKELGIVPSARKLLERYEL